VTVAKPVVKDIVEQTDFIGRFEAVDQGADSLACYRCCLPVPHA
jgi:hypothetical protein